MRNGTLPRVGWWLALMLLVAAGCSEKQPTEPGVGPVGVENPLAKLVTWVDSTDAIGVGRTLGANFGLLDRTAASAFTLWREEPSGGYRTIKDFDTPPSMRFLSQGGEYYTFFDFPLDPARFVNGTAHYVAQGAVSGLYGPSSPLSNRVGIPAALPRVDTTLVVVFPRDSVATDSMPVLVWKQVAGAAGYLLQVYQPRRDTKEADVFVEGRMHPLFQKSTTYFVAYLPANPGIPPDENVAYRLGSGPPAVVYEGRLPLLALQFYRWRVVALNADGRLINGNPGFTRAIIVSVGGNVEEHYMRSGFHVWFATR